MNPSKNTAVRNQNTEVIGYFRDIYPKIITFGFHLLGSQTKTANILLSLTWYVITPLSVVITAIFLTSL